MHLLVFEKVLVPRELGLTDFAPEDLVVPVFQFMVLFQIPQPSEQAATVPAVVSFFLNILEGIDVSSVVRFRGKGLVAMQADKIRLLSMHVLMLYKVPLVTERSRTGGACVPQFLSLLSWHFSLAAQLISTENIIRT